MAQKIFIDTEFTDFIDTQLISIGMVADSGEVFYAEVPYEDRICSVFVREVVMPLLGKAPNSACSSEDLGNLLITWLKLVRYRDAEVEICFDYQTDWDLFYDSLNGQIPSWCHPRRVGRNINELLRYEFHKKKICLNIMHYMMHWR
jgi:hypothetical protein